MEQSNLKPATMQVALLVGLTLCGYPAVAALSTIFGLDNRLMSIAVRVFIIVLCLAMLMQMRFVSPRNARVGIWAPFILFWVLYILRIVWDGYLISAHLSRDSYLYLVLAGGCLLPMLAVMLSNGAHSMTSQQSLTFCLVMLGAVSVGVLWAFKVSTNFQIGTQLDSARLALDVLNPISGGHVGGSLVILVVFSLVETRAIRKHGLRRAADAAALIVGTILLIASASRGPMVATLFVLTVYGVSRLGRKRGWASFFTLAGVFAGGAWLAVEVETKIGFSGLSRMLELFQLGGRGDLTASLRITSITAAWEQFLSSPFLGSGLEEQYSRFYPHNVVVEAFMATGIVGGTTFVVILAIASLAAWKILVSKSGAGWVAMLAIQYIVAAQFSGALWAASAMWTLIGAVTAVAYFKRKDELRTGS